MSAVREGGQLVDLARSTTEALEGGVTTAPVDRQGAQGGAVAAQFPRKFDARDPMDDVVRMRQQISDGQGNTPFGKLQYTDDIARWAIRKEQSVEASNFDSWFNRNYNKSDLAARQFAQEINPDFYSAREKLIMDRATEAAKLKIIQLRGPRSKEELWKVWMLETGRIELPEDWDRIGVNGENPETAKNQTAFTRGLLSLPKFRTGAERERAVQNPTTPFRSAAAAARGAQFASLNNTNNATNGVFSTRPDSQGAQFANRWLGMP
jgi:hypothetical protein